MSERLLNTHPAVCAAAVALAEASVPPDIQEVLLYGGTVIKPRSVGKSTYPAVQVMPSPLAQAVTAARTETLEEVARWHDARAEYYLARGWTKKAAIHQISAASIRVMKDDPAVG